MLNRDGGRKVERWEERNLNPFPPIAGIFAAAYDDKVEWVIAKGVASYREDHSQSSSDEWFSFGSTMAASLVANILSDPFVFQGWAHCNQGKCHLWKNHLKVLISLLN